jgi:hypothetical protein
MYVAGVGIAIAKASTVVNLVQINSTELSQSNLETYRLSEDR